MMERFYLHSWFVAAAAPPTPRLSDGGRGGVTEYLRRREVRVFHSERKVYYEG